MRIGILFLEEMQPLTQDSETEPSVVSHHKTYKIEHIKVKHC